MENENNNTETEVETVVEDTIIVQSVEDDKQELGGVSDEDNNEETGETDAKVDEVHETTRKPRAKKRIQALAKKNKDLEKELEELRAKNLSTDDNQGKDTSNNDKEPDVDDYDSFDEYDEALNEYNSKQDDDKKADTSEPEKLSDDNREIEAYNNLDELLDDARDDYPDFDEVVTNEELQISLELMENLTDFEDSAGEMLYRIASNKDLAKEISSLSTKQQYKRLVMLENDIEKGVVTQAKKIKGSKAPPPINPVGQRGSKINSLDDEDLSYEEHEELVNRGQSASKGGWL